MAFVWLKLGLPGTWQRLLCALRESRVPLQSMWIEVRWRGRKAWRNAAALNLKAPFDFARLKACRVVL